MGADHGQEEVNNSLEVKNNNPVEPHNGHTINEHLDSEHNKHSSVTKCKSTSAIVFLSFIFLLFVFSTDIGQLFSNRICVEEESNSCYANEKVTLNYSLLDFVSHSDNYTCGVLNNYDNCYS